MIRTPFTHLFSAFALLGMACAASAQLIPSIPPAAAPTPEYVPPPTPPPRDIPPVEVAPVAPSLIVLDAGGKLRVYTASLDEVSVALYPFDDDRRAKITTSAAARRTAIDRFVVENLEKVHAAQAMRPRVENISDFAALFAAKEVATPLTQERLLDRLQRDGAITPLHRVRLDEAISAYENARREQWKIETGADPMKIASFVGRQSFIDITRDAFASLDRLIAAAAPTIIEDAGALELRPEQRTKLDALATVLKADATGAHRVELVRPFVLDVLDVDQQKVLFRKRMGAEAEKDGKTK